MAWEKVYPDFQSLKSQAKLTIKSDGWSEHVVNAHSAESANREFQLDVNYSTHGNDGWFPGIEGFVRTLENNKGSVWYQPQGNDPIIIGISLEHMGALSNPTGQPEEGIMQFLGRVISGTNINDAFAWGAKTTDQSLTIGDDWIRISDYEWHSAYNNTDYGEIHNDTYLQDVGAGANICPFYMICNDGGNWPRYHECVITTDLPIFETDADLLEYCQSGGEYTNKILNYDPETPEEVYEKQFRFHYIKNVYGHNTRNASSYTGYRNYRLYPQSQRMCFYRVRATENSPWTLKLKGYSGSTVKSAPEYADPFGDDDAYTTLSDTPAVDYLHKSISFGDNNYYTKFRFYTDLPIYGNESQADDYINNIIDERSAENWNDISRAYSETVDPGYGLTDPGNDNGVNGQSYVKGARLWVMESSDLNHFFDDIFSDVNISSILAGTQLFGASAISCIMGVMYLPIDVDDVATVNGTKDTIKLGSWACPTAQGRYVWNNNKIVDCGSFFVARVYNDFRDFEMKLSLDLPYVGAVETSISRFLGKTLSIKYAVDITTGGCTAHIYADGIEMESHDGFMASLRPIQAIDQISHLNAVMGVIGSIGGREVGMINTATESFAGIATGSIGESGGGFNAPSSGVGPGGALELSAGAIADFYSLGQAIKDKPIAVRGSYAGCLGLFGPQKIHVRVQQPRVYRADNLLQIAGYPSGIGGRVGMFSGYLSVMSFQMADGFNGTADELQEIYGILQQGIYI